MAKVKISELPILTSGSLSTILVGDDNNTTYQIPLSVITASVIQMLSSSADARLDVLEAFQASVQSGSNNTLLNTFTSSYFIDSASFSRRINLATNEQDLTPYVTQIVVNVMSASVDSRLDNIESHTGSYATTSSLNDFSASIHTEILAATNEQDLSGITDRLDNLEGLTGSYATTGSNTFTDEQTAPSFIADQLTANDRAYVRRIAPIGNANIDVLGYISSSYGIYAREFVGDGRYLTNLSATTNWNYNQEYRVKKTEQLTFSGDYILENTYLIVDGGISNTIGEWDIRIGAHNGSITKTSNNTYLIEGPNSTSNASDGNLITQYFATASAMTVGYVWNSQDAGNEWPTYDITIGINNYPYEISTPNMLVNPTTGSESGTWTINVPADSYLTFGVWSGNSDNLTSTLQITLPYLFNEDNIKYSPNKYFKKEGKIFIGGNLLVKDSYIENNGQISVGGEVILIGNSQIVGTGTII